VKIITARYNGRLVTRKAFSDFQAWCIINTLVADGCTDIGMCFNVQKGMGIRALVASLKSLSIPDETIEAQLMERYQMSKDEAMEWARKARGG